MRNEPLTITIDPESELGRILEEHSDEPIVLLQGTSRFRVFREGVDPQANEDPWANYDPEKVREGLRKVAGLLSPEEGERMKELIYRGREEGTRPINRP
jgi:hypothetical protein